jgi:hypothetical protein
MVPELMDGAKLSVVSPAKTVVLGAVYENTGAPDVFTYMKVVDAVSPSASLTVRVMFAKLV